MSNPKPSSSPAAPSPKFEQAVFDNIYAHVLGHLAAAEWAKEKYGNHELVASHAARFAHAAMEQRTKPFRPVKYADGVVTKTPPPVPAQQLEGAPSQPIVEPEPIAELPASQPAPVTPQAGIAQPVTQPANPLAAMKELADLANR